MQDGDRRAMVALGHFLIAQDPEGEDRHVHRPGLGFDPIEQGSVVVGVVGVELESDDARRTGCQTGGFLVDERTGARQENDGVAGSEPGGDGGADLAAAPENGDDLAWMVRHALTLGQVVRINSARSHAVSDVRRCRGHCQCGSSICVSWTVPWGCSAGP
jgi:hypothetical protein